MRRIYVAYIVLLTLSFVSCAMFQRPPVVPVVAVPVIHVAPAPSIPQYDFKVGPDMTACLSFEGLVAYEEEQAKLYARLSYFKTLLIQYGAIFDEAPAPKGEPVKDGEIILPPLCPLCHQNCTPTNTPGTWSCSCGYNAGNPDWPSSDAKWMELILGKPTPR